MTLKEMRDIEAACEKAGKILDNSPVPRKGRIAWVPEFMYRRLLAMAKKKKCKPKKKGK
jgi:hypothetical protein